MVFETPSLNNAEVRILEPSAKRRRRDRFGKCQCHRIPFVRACDVALSHVGLAFKLEPRVAVIFVGGPARVGLQCVAVRYSGAGGIFEPFLRLYRTARKAKCEGSDPPAIGFDPAWMGGDRHAMA